MAQVGIIMGSQSDFPIMKEAIKVLEALGIKLEVDIVSAHRTPEKMTSYGTKAHISCSVCLREPFVEILTFVFQVVQYAVRGNFRIVLYFIPQTTDDSILSVASFQTRQYRGWRRRRRETDLRLVRDAGKSQVSFYF